MQVVYIFTKLCIESMNILEYLNILSLYCRNVSYHLVGSFIPIFIDIQTTCISLTHEGLLTKDEQNPRLCQWNCKSLALIE